MFFSLPRCTIYQLGESPRPNQLIKVTICTAAPRYEPHANASFPGCQLLHVAAPHVFFPHQTGCYLRLCGRFCRTWVICQVRTSYLSSPSAAGSSVAPETEGHRSSEVPGNSRGVAVGTDPSSLPSGVTTKPGQYICLRLCLPG